MGNALSLLQAPLVQILTGIALAYQGLNVPKIEALKVHRIKISHVCRCLSVCTTVKTIHPHSWQEWNQRRANAEHVKRNLIDRFTEGFDRFMDSSNNCKDHA